MTKQEFREFVGKNLRAVRIANNLTLEEFSEIMNLTPGFIGLIENGGRGLTAMNVYKVSEVLNVSIDKLLSGIIEDEDNLENEEQSRGVKWVDDVVLEFLSGGGGQAIYSVWENGYNEGQFRERLATVGRLVNQEKDVDEITLATAFDREYVEKLYNMLKFGIVNEKTNE